MDPKELKIKKASAVKRISKKTNNEYTVLVIEFDVNGKSYTVENFLNQDQAFILGI